MRVTEFEKRHLRPSMTLIAARASVHLYARARVGRICRRSGTGGEFNKLAFPSSASVPQLRREAKEDPCPGGWF